MKCIIHEFNSSRHWTGITKLRIDIQLTTKYILAKNFGRSKLLPISLRKKTRELYILFYRKIFSQSIWKNLPVHFSVLFLRIKGLKYLIALNETNFSLANQPATKKRWWFSCSFPKQLGCNDCQRDFHVISNTGWNNWKQQIFLIATLLSERKRLIWSLLLLFYSPWNISI